MRVHRGAPPRVLFTTGDWNAESIAMHQATLAEENAIEEIRERRFKKAMALKEELGLTKEERHELAQLLPGVDKDDGGSWKELNPKQLHDLITMMEGFVFLSHIFQNRLDSAAEKD